MFKQVKNVLTSLHCKTIFGLCMLLATPAFAGNNSYDQSGSSAFDNMFSWLAGLLTGSGGKILAILSLIACAASAVLGSYKIALGFAAVLLLTTVGPMVIDNAYTAIFW